MTELRYERERGDVCNTETGLMCHDMAYAIEAESIAFYRGAYHDVHHGNYGVSFQRRHAWCPFCQKPLP